MRYRSRRRRSFTRSRRSRRSRRSVRAQRIGYRF